MAGEAEAKQRRKPSYVLFSLCGRRGAHLPELVHATADGGVVAGSVAWTRDAAERNALPNPPALVRATGQALLPYFDRPFCFFGHSMGALLAFELAREIRREYALSPQHLFVSGRRAPAIPLPNKIIHDLPKQKFIEKLREMNGTTPEVLEHPELIQLLLPMLKADFAICETYEYRDDEPLNCGITVFGGLVDHL